MARLARLYRSCNTRDKDANYRLESKGEAIRGPRLVEEFLCHEYASAVNRQYLFSLTTSMRIAEECHAIWPGRSEIRYVDVDIDNLEPDIRTLFPLYDRKALMLYLASQPELIEKGYVVNPITGSRSSIISMLNYCRKGLCSMAHSLLEVMVQCDGLLLRPLEELENADEITEETTERLLAEYCNEKIQASKAGIIMSQEYLTEFFMAAPDLKEKRLLKDMMEIYRGRMLKLE